MTPIGPFRHALLPINLMVFELVSFVFVWAPWPQLRLQSYQLGVCDFYLFSLQHKSKLHAVTLADRNTRLRLQILFSSLKGLNVCCCHLKSPFLIQQRGSWSTHRPENTGTLLLVTVTDGTKEWSYTTLVSLLTMLVGTTATSLEAHYAQYACVWCLFLSFLHFSIKPGGILMQTWPSIHVLYNVFHVRKGLMDDSSM